MKLSSRVRNKISKKIYINNKMENYGNKRGYVGAGSGFLGIFQGKTNLEKGTGPMGSQLPVWSKPLPQYVNQSVDKMFLKYSRNGLKQPDKGKKRLVIPKTVDLQGGEPTRKDYNTI